MDIDPHVLRFAHHLAERTSSRLAVIDDPATALNSALPSEGIVLVSGGMRLLAETPSTAQALLLLSEHNHKVVVVDDIRSFPDTSILASVAAQAMLPLEFHGYTAGQDGNYQHVTVLSRALPEHFLPAPASFRVVAIISTFNEADIIEESLASLAANGIQAYVIDNWSHDGTFEVVQTLLNKGVIGLERWPMAGPSSTFQWKLILERKEALAHEIQADWFIQQDADEFRLPPWRNLTLRDAFHIVDAQGYNAVDSTLIEFRPVDDTFVPGAPLQEHLRHFSFDVHPSYRLQVKAWKNLDLPVALQAHAGHLVDFPGKRVFPWNFLVKHYPIRSQAHGERKIFRERQARWDEQERQRGWNVHYNAHHPGVSFLHSPLGLRRFDDTFFEEYLLERLARVGLAGGRLLQVAQDEWLGLRRELSELQALIRAFPQRLASERRAAETAQAASLARRRSWRLMRPLRRLYQALRMQRQLFDCFVIRSSALFDPDYYLSNNPDVVFADLDPLMHYVRNGWREGRNPSAEFDTAAYLRENPDVLNSGLDPLLHFLRRGRGTKSPRERGIAHEKPTGDSGGGPQPS